MTDIQEKHGWDERGGIYHCSDGAHNSWWVSISKTPQWEEWYKHASKNMLYDVDECLDCGWMSENHAKDFLNFIASTAIETARKEGHREYMELSVSEYLDKEIETALKEERERIWTEAKKMKRIFTEEDPDNIQDKKTYGGNLAIEDVLRIVDELIEKPQ
jgi:hypothetical protein